MWNSMFADMDGERRGAVEAVWDGWGGMKGFTDGTELTVCVCDTK